MHRAEESSGGWRDTDHLLAALIDAVNRLWELTRAANSDEQHGTYVPPEPTPRPGDAARKEQETAARAKAKAAARAVVDDMLNQLLPRG